MLNERKESTPASFLYKLLQANIFCQICLEQVLALLCPPNPTLIGFSSACLHPQTLDQQQQLATRMRQEMFLPITSPTHSCMPPLSYFCPTCSTAIYTSCFNSVINTFEPVTSCSGAYMVS